MDAHTGGVAARNEIEPWRVCRPVIADLHYFDHDKDTDQYESDPDLDLHISDTMDPDPYKSYADPHIPHL